MDEVRNPGDGRRGAETDVVAEPPSAQEHIEVRPKAASLVVGGMGGDPSFEVHGQWLVVVGVPRLDHNSRRTAQELQTVLDGIAATSRAEATSTGS